MHELNPIFKQLIIAISAIHHLSDFWSHNEQARLRHDKPGRNPGIQKLQRKKKKKGRESSHHLLRFTCAVNLKAFYTFRLYMGAELGLPH